MRRARILGFFIDENVLEFQLTGHHNYHLKHTEQRISEGLVIFVQHIKAKREADYETKVGCEKFEEIDGHSRKHLYIEAKHGKITDHNHQLDPGQQNTYGSNVMLPWTRWRNQDDAGCHYHAPL